MFNSNRLGGKASSGEAAPPLIAEKKKPIDQSIPAGDCDQKK